MRTYVHTHSHTHTHRHTHRHSQTYKKACSSFIHISSKWEHPKCPSAGEQINHGIVIQGNTAQQCKRMNYYYYPQQHR